MQKTRLTSECIYVAYIAFLFLEVELYRFNAQWNRFLKPSPCVTMEPAWSPHQATDRTGTPRCAAPACPPGGTPRTTAVSCHRRDGQRVYAEKFPFFLFLFPPQHLLRDRSHGGKWLNSHRYLFWSFQIKASDTLVTASSLHLDKRGAGGCGEEFVQIFPAAVTEMQLCCSAHSWMQSSSSTPTWACASLLFLEDWSCCPFPERWESIETSLDFSSEPSR